MQVKSGRRGVTLLEILVTMVISGVVLIGLGTLFASATGDYAELARSREERYSREMLETEMLWRLKSVPGEWLPTQNQVNNTRVTFPDERTGLPTLGDVLAYDYLFDDRRDLFIPTNGAGIGPTPGMVVSGGGCTVDVPRNIRVMTGMIFQWYTVVYFVEREITVGTGAITGAGNSFRNMGAGAVQAYITSLFSAAPPAGVVATPLGVGIRRLQFNIIDPPAGCDNQRNRRVEWRLEQFI